MAPKIAMLLDNPFRPDPRVRREAKALSDLGCEVTIYAWDRDSEYERPKSENCEGFDVVRIPVKTKQQMGLRQISFYLRFAWQVFWVVLRKDVDVIHCHDFLNLPIAVTLKLLKKVKLVYDAHEIYWLMEAQKYPQQVLNLIRNLEILLLRWVDVFITVGSSRVKYYQTYVRKEIIVVGNWYNPMTRMVHLREALRSRLRIPEDALVITVAGKLSPERASDVIIACASRFQNENKPIHWIVAGRGPSQDLFEKASEKNSNLHFLGWVDDTASLYSASDALVYLMDSDHPYTKYNVPNNLFLSIAWKLPLLGINSGEIKSVFASSEAGILIDNVNVDELYSAVSNLYEEPNKHNRITKALNKLQEVYSWDSAKGSLYSAYSKLFPQISQV